MREDISNIIHQNISYRLIVSVGAFIITISLLWSIVSRATNIFYLVNHKRMVAIGLIFIISFSFFIISLLNKRINILIISNIIGAGRPFIISILLSSLFASILFVGNLLPTGSMPFQHELIIKPLPNDENLENVVHIENIIEMIDAPAIGSNLVDIANIQFTGENYSIMGNEISLEEEAVLTYSSFYSGCVRIIFKTTPDSRKVFVQFDNVEETFSLYNADRDKTEVNLCSKYPLNQLPLKWKFIVLSDYFLNIVFLTTVFGFEIFFIFFKKEKTIVKSKKANP